MSILGLIGIVSTVIDRIIPDKSQAEKVKQELQKLELDQELKIQLSQLEINKTEAEHSSIFVAGPRPFIMWICAVALGVQYIIIPLVQILVALSNNQPIPTFDSSELTTILFSLLGLGGLRSYEKLKGVARNKV